MDLASGWREQGPWLVRFTDPRGRTAEEMAASFSRPICRWAMQLNDQASDEERQQLLPFVTRLACADTPEIEHQRAAYIEARLPSPFTFRAGLAVLEAALAI